MGRRFCTLLLLVIVQMCASVASDVKSKSREGPFICHRQVADVKSMVAEWIKAANDCEVGKLCQNEEHISQYNLMRNMCSKVKPQKEVKPLEEYLPAIDKALAAVPEKIDVLKADVSVLDQEFGGQLRGIWAELEHLQQELLGGYIGAGRVEKALLFDSIVVGKVPKLWDTFTAANVEEMLLYAWNLPASNHKQSAYQVIGNLVKSSKDPLLQAAYTIDLANVGELNATNTEARPESLAQLRANLETRSFSTLLELAQRYPSRYAYLRQHLKEFLGGEKPTPAELLAIASGFPRQLPTLSERLLTLKSLIEHYLIENDSITTDPSYLYPISKLAHEMAPLVGDQELVPVDDTGRTKGLSSGVSQMFNTPIDGRSAEYFSSSLLPKSSTI